MRENIELGSDKLNVSRHGRVVTDTNHENMSLFIVLDVLRLEEKYFRFRLGFVTRALFAVCLRGGRRRRENALFLLRPPSPRNF
jgi:hypothetical protein